MQRAMQKDNIQKIVMEGKAGMKTLNAKVGSNPIICPTLSNNVLCMTLFIINCISLFDFLII